jgi:hypothetical protein
MIAILRLFSQTITASIASSSRPALTFTVIQISIAVMVYLDWVFLPESFLWLIGPPALFIASALTISEYLAQHDENIAELLRELQLDKILSAFGAFSSALLFVSLGLPEEEASGLIAPSDSMGLTDTTQVLSQSQYSTPVQITAVVGSLGLNFTLAHVRSGLYDYLAEIELGQFLQRLETGGVVVALALLVFSPFLALAFFVVLLTIMIVFGLVVRSISRIFDSRSRVACHFCNASVRKEALICFECNAELTPRVWLDQPTRSSLSRFKEMWTTRNQVPYEQQ